ncbi:unnamed protein product [Rotaria sp. Silwood2]|nr:unnamed protein product [Rotaria sp. Silwood2]
MIDAYPLPKIYLNQASDKDEKYSIAFDIDQNETILLIKQVNKVEHKNTYICYTTNEFDLADMHTKLLILIRLYFIE